MSQNKYKWYTPKDPAPREQCPCCDYFSLPERGNYLICQICFWEDDGRDIDDLNSLGGPNGCSLREARDNFKKFGASELKFKEDVVMTERRGKYKYQPRDI